MLVPKPDYFPPSNPTRSSQTITASCGLVARNDSYEQFIGLALADSDDGVVAQIFRTLAICPEILDVFIPMADVIHQGCGIDPALREMAIVMACQTMGTNYENDHNWNRAIKKGVSKEQMLALWDFEKSLLFSELERAVLRLSRDATRAPSQVSSDVWKAVHRKLGPKQSLALLFNIGWYNMTGRLTGPLGLSNEANFTRL